MLDYRIATFMTLYREMNYRKTAEILRMTQPGVTQHIHFLENYYGVRLFTYDGRQLRRTKYAEALKRHVDSVRAKELALGKTFIQSTQIHLDVGATKTIGEFVLLDVLCDYLSVPDHSINFVIDNTEHLLQMLEDSRLDFAVIEGVFDKTKYGYHLFKNETYIGICAKGHPFAGKTVSLAEVFRQTLVIREPGSGTRRLLEQAIWDKGFSLDCFDRCVSVSNFSVILELIARENVITFGYMPVAAQRTDLDTFHVANMQISGEFNFVYCDKAVAEEKIALFFGQNLRRDTSAPSPRIIE